MSLVPGQPNESLFLFNERHTKINERLGFAFYYSDEAIGQVYAIEDGAAEAIVWADTPPQFDPIYRGHLGDKYYFFDIRAGGFVYEYNHSTKNTRKIPFPENQQCNGMLTALLTENFDGKICFYCPRTSSNDTAILNFDGNSFEVVETPLDHLIAGKYYVFVDSMDTLLIWFFNFSNNDGQQLYAFDGINLTHIPNPANGLLAYPQALIFQDQVLLTYEEPVGTVDGIQSLYQYDGSNLIEIPGLPPSVNNNINLFPTEDKVYIALNNYSESPSSLYEYNGNSISEIFDGTYNFPQFIAHFDGRDFFSIDNPDYASLFAYNGTIMEEITGAISPFPIEFSGILNDKLYLSYYDSTASSKKLYSHSAGQSEVESVNNIPQNSSYGSFQLKFNNILLHTFIEDDDVFLYAQNENNEFLSMDPTGYSAEDENFVFQLENKVYYSFADSEWIRKLFVWDGVLSTPDVEKDQHQIIIHPNPTSDIISIEIPKKIQSKALEISLYSVQGKRIKKQLSDHATSQISISLKDLTNGIYILELKGETEVCRKKIIKK